MFDQTFVNTHANTRKSWTVAVSLAAQTMLVGTLLLIPLLHPEILYPKIDTPIFVHLQPMKPVVEKVVAATLTTGRTSAPRAFIAPPSRNIPDSPRRIIDTDMAAPAYAFVQGDAIPGTGQGADVFSSLFQPGLPGAPLKEPKREPAMAKPPAPAGPIQVSSGVQSAKLVFGPRPAYPQIARTARVQGTVKIQAIIAADGSIGNLRTMSGPPLLTAAALDAVSRWRYQATLLNGKAVEVITEIDVIFSLGQ
jgi:protein TonB